MEIETYLQSKDNRYYVPDKNTKNAKIVIFECYPTQIDLKACASVSALKTWNGIELFGEYDSKDDSCVATVYISNVPLYSTDEYTQQFVNSFEAIRLSPRVESDYLRNAFCEKMVKIINNTNIRLVAYKLEMFKRYYNDFLAIADTEVVSKLKDRLKDGSLALLEFPRYTLKQIKEFEACYNYFKEAFDKIIE